MKAVTWQTITTTAEETEHLAEKVGAALRGGEVIELVSDLGGGKTTFVRGLMQGMGSSDVVSSPTFTISKLYRAKGLTVHHFDFYRLHEPGVIASELAEVVGDTEAVVIVEWADIVQHVLPATALKVVIAQTPEGNRLVTFECPEAVQYLVEGLNR